MLFSVIIPTFNRRDLLERTLDSVRAQRFTDYEVIVVDDGSTDGTVEMIEGAQSPVRLLKQSRRGPGAARNLGAREAQGEYVAFLDSDDLWFPWTLEVFASLVTRHERPGIMAARLQLFSDESELASVSEEPSAASVHPDYFSACNHHYFVGAGMSVLNREAFLAVGGFTELPINSEDHDLILRMGTVKGFTQVLTPVTLGWRRHPGSVTMDMARCLAGKRHLIEQELKGAYPGGAERRHERRTIISRNVRPDSMACLRRGLTRDAWALYRSLFRWHVVQGRWKYLAGFPVAALIEGFRRLPGKKNGL